MKTLICIPNDSIIKVIQEQNPSSEFGDEKKNV